MRGGCALAIAFGLLTVVIFYSLVFVVFGTPRGGIPFEEWPFPVIQILLASAPFGILAFRGVKSKLPWLVAGVLTISFWAAFFYSVWLAARDQTGANIGMGLLVLASPIVIVGGTLIAATLTRPR